LLLVKALRFDINVAEGCASFKTLPVADPKKQPKFTADLRYAGGSSSSSSSRHTNIKITFTESKTVQEDAVFITVLDAEMLLFLRAQSVATAPGSLEQRR
jgi:hypothetical protein